jgi:phenylalanyl-tRNA synthetase alpha chain
MQEKIEKILSEIDTLVLTSKEEVETYRIKWLSKKGEITTLFEEFRTVTPDLKKALGQKLNDLRTKAQDKINALKESLEAQSSVSENAVDVTVPNAPFISNGARHPLSLVREEIISIFSRIGFTVADGPEIEDDWHNFTALNTPENHPARDMQDTFYISKNPDYVLRTQTSSVQIRVMMNEQAPIRKIFPGRVYRNEAVSARAHLQFHQVEGLYIDKQVSFADLKQTLLFFAKEMFGADTKIRMRPSFFPFTEPSTEVDVSCSICKGEGCNVCKYTGWVEILGSGMVDPQVLINCGINPTVYTGFAFGMGIERITMLKYRVKDLRLFFENDIRFLDQFKSA